MTTKKIFIYGIAFIFMMVCTLGCAKVFQSGDFEYKVIDSDKKWVEIICFTNYDATEIEIPSSVISGDSKYIVTCIADSAFAYHYSLTSITIPNSVSNIGEWAFQGCSSLTSITIPNSVKSIGKVAFGYCSSLTEIKVAPDNPIYNSRDNCNAVIETKSNTLIAGCASTIIPSSVTSIGKSAFYGCDSLISITIPSSVTSIGETAFFNCDNLTSVNIPSSVTSIGETAFFNCDNLTSVNIPSSVTSIGEMAFPEWDN